MKLTIHSFADGSPIPQDYAMGKPAEPATFAANRSPHLSWADFPENTASFAVICVDPDAPSVGTDVNQPDRTVPYDLPRADFYHWVLVDIPTSRSQLEAGLDSEGVVTGGKEPIKLAYGQRGLNDYTGWFAGDDSMEGEYAGYDGPFPPWNDERVHRYVFTLYALDVQSLGLEGSFTGPQALDAMAGHILAQSSWTGTYHIYPGAK